MSGCHFVENQRDCSPGCQPEPVMMTSGPRRVVILVRLHRGKAVQFALATGAPPCSCVPPPSQRRHLAFDAAPSARGARGGRGGRGRNVPSTGRTAPRWRPPRQSLVPPVISTVVVVSEQQRLMTASWLRHGAGGGRHTGDRDRVLPPTRDRSTPSDPPAMRILPSSSVVARRARASGVQHHAGDGAAGDIDDVARAEHAVGVAAAGHQHLRVPRHALLHAPYRAAESRPGRREGAALWIEHLERVQRGPVLARAARDHDVAVEQALWPCARCARMRASRPAYHAFTDGSKISAESVAASDVTGPLSVSVVTSVVPPIT